MGSSSKTITDYDVVPIMKGTGELYKNLSLEAFRHINQGMRTVIDVYGQGIVKIGGLYNDGFLTAMGYNPSENIAYSVVDSDKLLQWVRDNLDPNATSINSYRLGSVTMEDMAIRYMQENYPPFSYNNRTYTDIDGKIYIYLDVVGNGPNVDIITYLNSGDTIDEYVAANWSDWSVVSYPIAPTEVDGVLVWRVEITRTYMTEPEPPGEPEEVTETQQIEVDVVYNYKSTPDKNYADAMAIVNKYNGYTISKNYVREYYDHSYYIYGYARATVTYIGNLNFNVTYVSSGEAAYEARTECFNYVEPGIDRDRKSSLENIVFVWSNNGTSRLHYESKSDMGSVYSTRSAEAYPIIPLKVNGSLVKDTTKRTVVLGKVGLSGDDFASSLRDNDLNSAFLIFGISMTDTSPVGVKFIFETLYGLVSTSTTTGKFSNTRETLRVSFSTLDITTRLDVVTRVVVGSIGPVGTYTHQLVTTTTIETDWDGNSTTIYNYKRVYRKQADPLYYEEISAENAATEYTVAGYKFSANMIDSKCILPVSRQILFKIDYRSTCDVIEKSMKMMVFMKKTVKVKWYQSGFFSFIMMIVAVVLTVVSWGALSSVGATIAGIGLSVGQVIAVAGLIIGLAGIMGINTGVLGQVIAVVGALYGGWSGLAKGGWQGTLVTANSLVQVTSMANSIMIQKDIASVMRDVEKQVTMTKEARDELAEVLEDMQNPLLMPYSNRLDEIDTYYAVASGNLQYNYDILYNYDLIYNENMIT